jgi:VWFA-related protein
MLIRLAAAIALSALALQQTPVFRSGIEIVQLDVSVLDRNRRPVRGLTQADFTVLEDGKQRPIAGFTSFDIEPDPEPSAGWMRDVSPDITTNEQRQRRLMILVMDDAMIPQIPDAIRDSKKIALSIIDRLSADDYVALVYTGDGRWAQGFTNDKTKLRAALDGLKPGLTGYRFGLDTGGVDVDLHFYMGAVRTLSDIADYLIAVPHRRKALFWVSPGVPFDSLELAPIRALTPGEAFKNPSAKPVSVAIDMRDLMERINLIFERARQSNVTIYPIDPMGLGGMKVFLESRRLPEEVVVRKTAALQDSLAMAAANTGGRTVMNTNDWDPGITAIFEENQSYYLIGYESASSKPDGRLHRVDVKVNRPNVDVRTRSTYAAPKPPKPADPKTPPVSPESQALREAIAGVMPDAALPMRVAVAPIAIADDKLVSVAVVLGVRQPIAAKSTERITETTELQISVFTPEGSHRETTRHTARLVIRPGADAEAAYEVLGLIELPAGRYALRVAAHNGTTKKSGSVFTDVVVPAFAEAPFSATPILFATSPGRASAPTGVFWNVLPIVPTADREFAGAQNVSAFMRVFQVGKRPIEPVTVTVLIRNAADQIVERDSRTIEARQFANPGLASADFRYGVPTWRLPPGQYLLTFEASLGDTVLRRDIRFRVY